MENRVFVYKRLNGKETAITGGSFGTSYQMRTIRPVNDESDVEYAPVVDQVVDTPVVPVVEEQYEEQQEEQFNYDDYFEELYKQKAKEEYINSLFSKRNIRKMETKITEREVKEVADKYINPILLKTFGVKINHKAVAKELVKIRRKFK